MARRTKKDEENTPTSEEENVTTTAPEETVENDATDTAEEAVDLSAFQTALDSALASADADTGDVAVADRAPVVAAYRDLSGQKAKSEARKVAEQGMKDAMVEGNFTVARAYMVIKDDLTSAPSGGGRRERTPTNPTEAFIETDAALRIAHSLIHVPENLDEDWEERVNALLESVQPEIDQYKAWLDDENEDKDDAPEVSPVVQRAAKLAAGRAAGRRATGSRAPYTGTRRDIAKHITEAFEDVDSGGFLTVAEIKNFKSSEYGDDHPSAGAISARLFPAGDKQCNVEGVEPGTNDKSRGAFKVA